MTEENVVRIIKGRHLLQELCVPSFVENDTEIIGGQGGKDLITQAPPEDNGNPSLVILTGANYSGKSVLLKQVGRPSYLCSDTGTQVASIVYLAHIGSFVPAESAEIGLTDKILTRIQTKESVSKQQSAFMIDVQQIALSLQTMTHRSLLVIDEFGKGTAGVDGAALFGALLEYLIHREEHMPKVLTATHFHEVFEQNLLNLYSVTFKHMQIVVDDQHTTRNVTYLYR